MPNTHPDPSKHLPRRTWALVALGAVLPVLLIAGLGGFALLQSRVQYEQRAELLSQNLAVALDRSVTANIEKIDLALSSIVDHLDTQLARGPLDVAAANAHIRSQIARRPELEGLRVTDRRGQGVLGPGLSPQKPIDFSEREWFIAQRDLADPGLYMSRPLISKISHEWIMSFSRRYRTPGGEFAGAVTAAVPLSYFQRQLAAIDVGAHGIVVLRDVRLGLIARYPAAKLPTANEVGNRQVSAELRGLVESGLSAATYRASEPLDPVGRTMSFYRLQVAPLMVIVGLGSDDFLADWQNEVRVFAAIGLGVVLVYGVGAWLLLRALTQNRQARARIDLLAKVFEHSGEAIVMTDRDNRIVEVNPAFLRQTGYAVAEVIGRDPKLLASGRTTPAEYQAMWQAIHTTGGWRGELWDRNKDGQERPKLMSIAVVRDARGEVSHHIGSSVDISEAKRFEARMLHLAHHDTLTRLPNRVHLHARLEQAMASARRNGDELAMLFIDMDRFKNINDTLGHHVGDGLLVEVGQRLRGIVRDSDIVARLGGDEFVLVLTGVGGLRSVASVAAKVLHLLGQPYPVDGHELHSTPSIGISLFPDDGADADTLMKNADAAMYAAKAAGRNNFQFFTPAMNQASAERLAIEVGLRHAIERGELFVHYQPQLDLATGRVVGVEALLRWRHPEMGLIPPLKFIPIAEDTGQIEAVGAWVLDQALAQVAHWRAEGQPMLRVAVNLSARQLRGDGLAGLVSQCLQRHRLPGEALELEITESIAMRDPARTGQLLGQLRGQGVALAIDDFGTGYSSLAYLKQLPLSCLKLDRSFVMDIEHDPNDAAICTATIQMAHSLGLAVVAEGVETAAQLAFLRGLGCDLVQGYFISRPMPAADFQRFMQDHESAAVV